MADASQAWIMVTVIGILCGLIASAISVSSDWLGDIKEGFCTDGFWKHRHACCTSSKFFEGFYFLFIEPLFLYFKYSHRKRMI